MTGLSLFGSTMALGVLFGLSPTTPRVEVRDWDDGGRVVQTLRTDDGGTFRLQFTHSMYGGTVTESYRVVNGPAAALERSDVRTENGGAAEYYAPLGNYHQEGGAWVVEVETLRVPRLFLSVTHIGNQAIASGNSRIALSTVIPEGHVAELVPVG